MRNEVSNACVCVRECARVCVCVWGYLSVCLCLLSRKLLVAVAKLDLIIVSSLSLPACMTRVVFIRFVSASISFNVLWRDVP